MGMIKVPAYLVKGLADSTEGLDRFMIEIPEHFAAMGRELRKYRGEHFVLIGPLGAESDLQQVVDVLNNAFEEVEE